MVHHKMLSKKSLADKYLDACYLGNIKMVKHMLQKENRVFKNDYFLLDCLKRACDGDSSIGRNGNCIKLCTTILKYRDINKMIPRCVYRLLLHTSKMGNLALVKLYTKLYLKFGTDDYPHYECMMYSACLSGNVDLINYMLHLIYTGEDNYARLSLRKLRCFANAFSSGNMKSIELLKRYNFDEETNSSLNQVLSFEYIKSNCLRNACESGNIEIVKYAIAKGSEVSNQCFFWAGSSGDMEIINLIASYLTDLTENVDFDEIMYGACCNGRLEIIKLFIDKIDYDNTVSCISAACQNGHAEIVKYMIKINRCCNSIEDWNICADRACMIDERINNAEILELLIKKGANEFNKYMYHVCLHGLFDFAEALVKNGATDLDDGLLGACKGGHHDLARLMIHHGATKLNRNLMYTFHSNVYLHPDICKLLLMNGANNVDRLEETDDFQLHCIWLRSEGIKPDRNDDKWMQLLAEHPTCVLLVCCKIMKKRAKCSSVVKRLPDELFVLLSKY